MIKFVQMGDNYFGEENTYKINLIRLEKSNNSDEYKIFYFTPSGFNLNVATCPDRATAHAAVTNLIHRLGGKVEHDPYHDTPLLPLA